MKIKRNVLTVLALSACAFGAMGFASCGTKTPAAKLPAPELTVVDEGIYWTNITGASGYSYRVNEGNWTNTKETFAAFSTTVGSYVFEVKATGGDAAVTTLEYVVKTAEVTATAEENTFVFTGDNIYYSVNGGAEAALENGVLDFSSATVGDAFTVEYYTKGGFWSKEESAYYVDGAKQTASLTVTAMLSAPVLTTSEAGVSWTAVENATGYEVTIDGVTSTQTETQVAFPAAAGAHVIGVKALGDGGYKASREAVVEMTTETSYVPSVTYIASSQKIVWAAQYVGLMQSSTGGEYQAAAGNEIAVSAGLTLKVAAYFDEATGVYYPESKPLAFEMRSLPEASFDPVGKISWSKTDGGEAKTYYVSVKTTGEEFNATTANEMDVTNLAVGTYSFRVYGADYLSETADGATLYLPSPVTEFAFTVLDPVELSYDTNKLLWTVDELAYSYEYKIGDGEWTAADGGEVAVTTMTTCYVRALGGKEDENFVVNGKEASLLFDPALTTSAIGVRQLATFDDAAYAQNLMKSGTTSTGTSAIVTAENATAEEQEILAGASGGMLKLTAGSAGPRNSNLWGNSDGVTFNLFKPVKAELNTQIVFRVYLKSNAERTTATWTQNGEEKTENLEGRFVFGASGKNRVNENANFENSSWPRDLETDKWVTFTVNLGVYFVGGTDPYGKEIDGMSEINGVFIQFQENGKAGDVAYLDWVTFENVKANTTNLDFDENEEYAKTFVSKASPVVEEDELGTNGKVLKIPNVWKGDGGASVKFADIELPASTKISITMRVVSESDNGGSIDLNGSYQMDFQNSAEWKTYVITLSSDTVLSSIKFGPYNPSKGYTLYFDTIVIEIPKTATLDYTNLDVSENEDAIAAFSAKSTPELFFDETLQKNVVKFPGVWKTDGAYINYPSLAVKAGSVIKVTMKCTSSAGNGGGFDIYTAAGSSFGKNFANNNTWATYEYTVSADITLTALRFAGYTPNAAYEICIASVVIVAPQA